MEVHPMTVKTIAVALAAMLSAGSGVITAPSHADAAFVIYLAPRGANVNDGRTQETAVRTLERVEQIAATATTDVEVRIAQGTYNIGHTKWDTYIPGHTITFMPVDYQTGEGVDSIADRPVFRGGGADWWFEARLPAGHPGGVTGLRFYYLQVEQYARGGILIHGGYTTVDGMRVPSTTGANGNTFYGMYFRQLGSAWTSAEGFGVGAIDLVNSSDNLIRANHFTYLMNSTPDESHIHGVYAAHGSSRNQIMNNSFRYITGAPVNFRNASNANEVTGGTFQYAGIKSYYSEFFCGPTCQITHTGGGECPSQNNQFYDNDLISGYHGDDIPLVLLYPADVTHAAAPDAVGACGSRVYVHGNE